jgi:hypothetical protein
MVNKSRYFIVFFITMLIFIVGILIGIQFTESRIAEVQNRLQADVLQMQSLELEMSVVKQMSNSSICSYIEYRLPEIIQNKVELGRKFDVTGFPPEQAQILQKQYIISLVNYWMFTELQEKECNIDKPRILFFFKQDEASREQGRVLDYVVYRSGQNVTVFAFNTQFKEPLIKLMTTRYNITETPTIVIKEEIYTGFQSVVNVTDLVCSKYQMGFC